MKTITLFEFERKKYKDVEELNNIDTLNAIQNFIGNNKEYQDEGIFTLYKDYIKTSSFVGFGLFNNVQIEVLPKLYRDETLLLKEKRKEAIECFLRLMDFAYGLNIKEYEYAKLNSRITNQSLYEIFIYLFSKTLLDEIRNGYYREYTEIQREERYLKGKLLVGKQVIKLPHQRHKFSIEYDIFNEDNLLNRVFYLAAYISSLYSRWFWNKKNLSELTFLLQDVSLDYNIINKLDEVIFSRLNQRFIIPFNFAKIILKSFLNQSKKEGAGFFIDMNKLFEYYVYRALKKAFPDMKVKYQKGIGHLLERQQSQIPDITLIDKNGKNLLVEVKYKEYSSVGRNDLYQVYAYTKVGNADVILVYPRRKGFNQKLEEQEKIFFDGGKLFILPFNIGIISKIPSIRSPELPQDFYNSITNIIADYKGVNRSL